MKPFPVLGPEGQLLLTPFPESVVHALISGRVPPIDTAEDWPQQGTVFGLRMSIEHGHPPGWMVVEGALVIGDCGIHSAPDQHGVVEIGYGLASSYRSKGIGTRVVRMISEYLGSLPEVTKVIAQTEPDNFPSQRVLTKNGFVQVESEGDLLRFERATAH